MRKIGKFFSTLLQLEKYDAATSFGMGAFSIIVGFVAYGFIVEVINNFYEFLSLILQFLKIAVTLGSVLCVCIITGAMLRRFLFKEDPGQHVRMRESRQESEIALKDIADVITEVEQLREEEPDLGMGIFEIVDFDSKFCTEKMLFSFVGFCRDIIFVNSKNDLIQIAELFNAEIRSKETLAGNEIYQVGYGDWVFEIYPCAQEKKKWTDFRSELDFGKGI